MLHACNERVELNFIELDYLNPKKAVVVVRLPGLSPGLNFAFSDEYWPNGCSERAAGSCSVVRYEHRFSDSRVHGCFSVGVKVLSRSVSTKDVILAKIWCYA